MTNGKAIALTRWTFVGKVMSLFFNMLSRLVMLVICCLAFLPRSGSEVTQSCLTLCDPVDCSPPGSSVHGILHARVLDWVAISFTFPKCLTGNWTVHSSVHQIVCDDAIKYITFSEGSKLWFGEEEGVRRGSSRERRL